MKRFFSLLMVPVVGIALSFAVPTATAQEKKDTKKAAKKDTAKKTSKKDAKKKDAPAK